MQEGTQEHQLTTKAGKDVGKIKIRFNKIGLRKSKTHVAAVRNMDSIEMANVGDSNRIPPFLSDLEPKKEAPKFDEDAALLSIRELAK